MRLSDFRGKRGAKAMAGLMRLAEKVAGDPSVERLFEAAKSGGDADMLAAVAGLAPLLEDDEILDGAVSVIAEIRGEDAEVVAEDGDIVGEFIELFTSDVSVPGFFGSASETTQE